MPFAQKLAVLMKQNAVSSYRLAKETGVRTSTVTGWLGGRAPQIAHLKNVADYFGVTTDYLTSTTAPTPATAKPAATPAPANDELMGYLEELRQSPEKQMFFSLTKNASKEDVEAAVRIVEAFLKERGGE